MVHAYDHCRAKIDNQNCLHIACTEVIVSFSSSNLQIRASSLSGDCNYTQELMRGHWRDKIEKHHEVSEKFEPLFTSKECVRRRAALSVKMHPECSAPGLFQFL